MAWYLAVGLGAAALAGGVWAWRHFRCPTKAQMADLLHEIDTGKYGREDAMRAADHLHDRGCLTQEAQVRDFIAKKYPKPTTATPPAPPKHEMETAPFKPPPKPAPKPWPESDTVCNTAIKALPTEFSAYEYSGGPLVTVNLQERFAEALAAGTWKPMHDLSVLITDNLADVGFVERIPLNTAAKCMREHATTLPTMKVGALDGLPKSPRRGDDGAALPSFHEIAVGAFKSGSPRALYNAADIIDANADVGNLGREHRSAAAALRETAEVAQARASARKSNTIVMEPAKVTGNAARDRVLARLRR